MEEKTKKVLVCEVSGNVVQNTEIRIQEHYQGRLYLGWKKVRDRYALIKDKYKDKRHPNPQWRHRTKGEKEAAGKERRPAERSYSRRDDRGGGEGGGSRGRRGPTDRPRTRRRSRDDDRGGGVRAPAHARSAVRANGARGRGRRGRGTPAVFLPHTQRAGLQKRG